MKKNLFVFILFLLITGQIYAQVTINGQMKNESGEPIPGANITVKGTYHGTITDIDGNYTIENVPEDATLVYSFIGMLSREIGVEGQKQINVTLKEDILKLDEVVVIGYGAVKKRDLTGSVTSVKTDEITQSPTHNAIEAIQGKVPGMDIVRSSGTAGSGVDILIRGTRSINGSNSPLFIIDGVQGGSYGDLNPADIESVEVLKDASSTAIYGSQGANGVIIITTKKGNANKTKVSYNGFYGVYGLVQYPEVRLGEEYIDFRKEAYRTSGLWDPDVNTDEDYDIIFPNDKELAAVDSNKWVDWLDLLLRNGTQQSHQVSVSGGNEKLTSYISVGYFKEEGVLKKDDMTRYTGRINLDYTINKWAKTGMQTQITYYDQNRRKDPLSKAVSISPLGEAFDENGDINVYPIAGSSTTISPLTDERNNIAIDNTIKTNIFTNAFVELTPIKGLTYRSNMGVSLRFSRRGIYYDASSLAQESSKTTTSSVTSTNTRYYTWDNILTYSKEIAQHAFTITVLTSYTDKKYDDVYASGDEQDNAASLFYNLGSTESDGRDITSSYEESTSMSFAMRLHYSYKSKYLLTASYRYDGASQLAEDHKWDYFPSVAAAWRVSDEQFMQNIKPVSDLKLRLSYGVTGNSGISAYGTQSGVYAYTTGFGDESAVAYKFNSTIGNETLGWEKSATIDFGIDFGLFKNRLSGTLDLYSTETTDILLLRELPTLSGVDNVYQNVGSTKNRGVEILINSVIVNTKNFKWSSSVTFSRNKEEITDLIDNEDIIDSEDNSLFIGKPINSFYTYKKLGIWQLGEEEEMDQYNLNYEPGDIKIADLNNDSTISGDDRECIGSAVPEWVAGFQNRFSYKSFELSVYLFARWGQMIDAEFLGRYNPSGSGNGIAYFDYWTPENPTNDFPRPERGTTLSNYIGYQTLNYVDGSYFKVKNITLSYTLPKKYTQKVRVDRIRVYSTASNIYTLANSHLVKYYDPERGGSESAPLSRQIIFGVNIDF